jgi:hypothetical protein
MDEQHGRRVPEEFVDPRSMQSYRFLSVFQKVMALKTFEHKFIAFVHAPMDQDGIDKLTSHMDWILGASDNDPRLDDAAWEDMRSTITLEIVREASIEIVLRYFYNMGIDDYPLDIILDGWQDFGPSDGLYEIVSGLNYSE